MERVSCELKYSGVAVGFLALAVAGTLALVTFVPFPGAVRAAAYGLVIAAACHAHAKILGIRALEVDCRRAVAVRDAGGAWRHGTLRDGSFVAPWLTIVRWRPEGARFDRTLLVAPDMLAAGEMRRLAVILRWAQ